jgi:UDP-GlcNAc3NAcA epimerase
MKIVTVVGARPQFIKAAAISREISNHHDITEIIIHTGQHFDKNMSNIFFEEMKIPNPDYNLNINSMNHGAMTGKMLEGIENILLKEKPDFVMVYGDTNSTLAGALAAKKLYIKVVHVEAGLRSFNMKMPEEINRIIADRLSDILCCPTEKAIKNLKLEGFDNFSCKFVNTGDVMQDNAIFYSRISSEKSCIIQNLKLENKNFLLCTIHRAENTDDINKLNSIISALNELSKKNEVVLPVHPRTSQILRDKNIKTNFKVIDPVSYFDMIELLKKTKGILTDSGGLQKEAFFFENPCITLRNETEWTELVENGFNKIAGTDKDKIISCYNEMMNKKFNFNINLYGNGNASNNIIKAIKEK